MEGNSTIQIIAASLRPLFPSSYHNYSFAEQPWGFSLFTLHWSCYIVVVCTVSVCIYLLLAWENSKWSLPLKIKFSWLKLVASFLFSLVTAGGIMFLIFGHDISRLDVNIKENYIIVHGIFSTERIDFSQIADIKVVSVNVSRSRTSSARNDFYLVSGERRVLCFSGGKWTEYDAPENIEFSKYTSRIAAELNTIIRLSKKQ